MVWGVLEEGGGLGCIGREEAVVWDALEERRGWSGMD